MSLRTCARGGGGDDRQGERFHFLHQQIDARVRTRKRRSGGGGKLSRSLRIDFFYRRA